MARSGDLATAARATALAAGTMHRRSPRLRSGLVYPASSIPGFLAELHPACRLVAPLTVSPVPRASAGRSEIAGSGRSRRRLLAVRAVVIGVSDGVFKRLLEFFLAQKVPCLSIDRFLQRLHVDVDILRSGVWIANAGHGGLQCVAIGRVDGFHTIDNAGCRCALMIVIAGVGADGFVSGIVDRFEFGAVHNVPCMSHDPCLYQVQVDVDALRFGPLFAQALHGGLESVEQGHVGGMRRIVSAGRRFAVLIVKGGAGGFVS